MPTVIAIESKTVEEFGVRSPYEHLYLVKRITDSAGNVIDERVIRGGFSDNGDDLVTRSNIPLALSEDARGAETLVDRHHRVLDLGGRDPEAVWSLMVQHAQNINTADLSYSIDITNSVSGPDLNSNTVVASVLHTAGLRRRDQPSDRDHASRRASLRPGFGHARGRRPKGSAEADLIYGGVGNDRIDGRRG